MFIATLSDDRFKIDTLVGMGFRNFRINFGRRSVERNFGTIDHCRSILTGAPNSASIMADLPGQKFRCGRFVDGYCHLIQGSEVILSSRSGLCTSMEILEVPRELIKFATPGDYVQFGPNVKIEVITKNHSQLLCKVQNSGRVYNRCGLEVYSRYLPRSGLTALDRELLLMSKGLVNEICVSFADDAETVSEAVYLAKKQCAIIAKIESPAAIANLDTIAAACDGLMLGRGDLSIFQSPTELLESAALVCAAARKHRTKAYLATDYFRDMAQGGTEPSVRDLEDLRSARSVNPCGIVLNETASSENWKHIAEVAMELQGNV